MRVAAIKCLGHAGLGDFELDFREPGGESPRIIVLAGENGCGKTAILEGIFAALAPTNLLLNLPRRLAGGKYSIFVEPHEDLRNKDFGPPSNPTKTSFTNTRPPMDGVFIEVDGKAKFPPDNLSNRIFNNTNGSCSINNSTDDILGSDRLCYFSEANTNFESKPIINITNLSSPSESSRLPAHLRFPVRSNSGIADELTQLFVDLQAADDADTARWLDQNKEGRPTDAFRRKRISKIADEIEKLLPGKRYVGTEVVNGEHCPMFESFGRKTPINLLSTGEKQIIYRGAFLLREIDNLRHSVILIDEPELSLHPSLQSGIVNFYGSILDHNTQTHNQLIIATHSPFVVHGSPNAKHVIIRRRGDGLICVEKSPHYPGLTPRDVAIAAFDVGDFAAAHSGKRLALVTEGPTDKKIIETAWEKLRDTPPPFVVLSAGGASNLSRLLGNQQGEKGPLLSALDHSDVSRVLGIFDFDMEGCAQFNGSIKEQYNDDNFKSAQNIKARKRAGSMVWASLLPRPDYRAQYASDDLRLSSQSKMTIELLFPDEHVASHLSSVPLVSVPSVSLLEASTNSQKQSVATAAENFPNEAFCAFEPLFLLCEEVLAFTEST